jgi:hypothetical protein
MAIFEQRTYSIAVGMVEDYLRFYHQEGMAIHTKFLGPPHAWFTTEVGTLTEIIMMWRYESHADREQKRAALYSDPEWLAFIPKTRPYIVKMENKILKPAFFSPLQ